MRYLIFLSLSLLILSCNSKKEITTGHTEETHILKGNVSLDGGVGNLGIEVYAFAEGKMYPEKEDMITSVKTDEKGNYTLILPDSVKKYQLHFTSPNYVTYSTKFITRDTAPELDVILRPNAILKNFDTVRIYGDFNNFSWANMMDMQKTDSMHYEITIDYAKPEMKYEIRFNTEEHTYPNVVPGAGYEYDFGGDHRTMEKSEDGKYHITVNLDNYIMIDSPNDRPRSEGKFKNAPVNEIYSMLVKKLGGDFLSQISMNYFIVVKKSNDDYLKDMTAEDIQNAADWTLKKHLECLELADSILGTTENQYIKDFLLAAKIKLIFMPDSADYDKAWALFEQIKEIPDEHSDFFTRFIFKEGFKKNPGKVMTAIENMINKVQDEGDRARFLYDYYSTLEDQIDDTNKYREIVIAGFEKIKSMKIKQGWLRESVNKHIAQIKLDSETLAPDFEFTLLNASQSRLSIFKGNWVLLHFWSIGCGWCVKETPYLVEAYKKYKDKNFFIISVADCPDLEGTVKYIEKNHMDWINTVAIDGYAKEAISVYGVTGVPSLFLINPDGEIVRGEDVDLRGSGLIKTLDKYIGRKEI